jgi:EF hand domain-containing protein
MMRTVAAGSTVKQRKTNNMKNKITIALAVLALGASAFVASAQDNNTPPNGGGQDWQNGPGGPGGRMGHRPPPSPLMEALDVNHDGVIDADEIANAPAALKALDKNGDGKLTQDELRPSRPPQDSGHDSNNDRPPDPPPGNQ